MYTQVCVYTKDKGEANEALISGKNLIGCPKSQKS